MWKVEEPSRCEYVAQMDTPAVCREVDVRALEEELVNKERAIREAGAAGGGSGGGVHDEL